MKPKEKITSLPLAQQVALFVILRMPSADRKNFSFLSSQFAKDFKPFVQKYISSNSEEYGKFVGAILSGLSRNDILSRLSGDRDKLWTLSNNVKTNFDQYKKYLFEIKTYWI